MKKSWLFLLVLCLSGCVRSYCYEESSCIQTSVHANGTVNAEQHSTGSGRVWRGFWPWP